MKLWKLAGLLTGLVLVSLVVRKVKVALANVEKDSNKRYNIDDFIADQEL